MRSSLLCIAAIAAFAPAFFTGTWAPRSLAQERPGLTEIEKELQAGLKGGLEKVGKLLKAQEDRIAELEKQVKARDQELAELKKKVEELAAGKPKAQPDAAAAKKGTSLLGVEHEEPGDDARSKLNLKSGQGAKVVRLEPDSPADKAGIKEGDVIVSFGGKEIGSAGLRDAVRSRAPGEKVELVLLRGAERLTRSVELADREKFLAEAEKKPDSAPKPEPVVLGLLIEETEHGLTVKNVEAGKTGAAAQLKEEDIILSFNTKPVKKLEDITEARDLLRIGQEFTIEYKRKDDVVRATVTAAGEKGESKLVKSEKVAAGKPPEKPAEKAADKPAEKKAPASLGVVVVEEDSGLRVLEVRPGSAAADAGIQKDDLLREVGDQKVKTIEELKNVLKGRSAGDELKVVLARAGADKTLDKVKLKAAGEAPAVASAEPKAEPKPEAKPDTKAAAKAEEKPPAPPEKKKGYLGISASETEDLRIVVTMVNSGGPAEKAGLKKDDVIVKVNGVDIKGFDALDRVMKNVFAGDTLKLVVKRGDETKELEFQVGAPPPATDLQSSVQPAEGYERQGAPGLYVGLVLLEEVLGDLALAAAPITVDRVTAGSPADKAGLKRGDEVEALGGKPVKTLDDFAALLKGRAAGDRIDLRLTREGKPVQATIVLRAAGVR